MAGGLLVLVMTVALVLVSTPVLRAQTTEFEIVVPVSTVVRAPEGSETVLAVAATPQGLIGETCEVSAQSENQSSVHPGNDLVLVTGSDSVVLRDVEAEPGGVVVATDTVVLGEQITITLVMGPDQVFSAGIEVRFDCPPEATTTTTMETTTTVETTTTSEATTTSQATTSTVAGTTITTTETTTTVAGTTISSAPPTSPTVADEVLGTEVLPFTGFEITGVGGLALAATSLGLLALVGARTRADRPAIALLPWRRHCARCASEAGYQTPHGRMCFTHMRQALDEDDQLWLPVRLRR